MASPKGRVSPALQAKRRKAVQGMLEGKTVKESLVEAGWSETSAAKHPGEILKGLQAEFAEVLDGMFPREAMISTLIEGLGAVKSTFVYNPKLGETERFDQPDFFQRCKCAELLGKLGGLITRKEQVKVECEIDHGAIIAARRRAGMLPPAEPDAPAEPDVTVEALPVLEPGDNPEKS